METQEGPDAQLHEGQEFLQLVHQQPLSLCISSHCHCAARCGVSINITCNYVGDRIFLVILMIICTYTLVMLLSIQPIINLEVQ